MTRTFFRPLPSPPSDRSPFMTSSATCTLVIATSSEISIVQLGDDTGARHIHDLERLDYPIRSGQGSFSLNPKIPCVPDILKLPVCGNRKKKLDMIMLGTRRFWRLCPAEMIRDKAKTHHSGAHGMCRILTDHALKALTPEERQLGNGVACALLNCALI